MTLALIKRTGHLWATIFVVYALLLSSLVPALAAQSAVETGLVICSGDGTNGPPTPVDGTAHKAMCCVLCQLPALSARPVRDAAPAQPFAMTVWQPLAGDATRVLPHPSPGSAPQSSRAPPIPA